MNKNLFSKNYILVVTAAILFYIAAFMLNSVCGRYTMELRADKFVVGVATAVFTLVSFFTRPLWGWICDCKSRKVVFVLGAVLCVVSSVILVFSASVMLLMVARAIFGGGYSAVTTAGGTIVCDIVDRKQLPRAISYYGISGVISQAVAPGLGLWLYDYSFSAVALALVAVTGVVVVCGIFIRYNREEFLNKDSKFRLYEKTALPRAFTIVFFAMASSSIYSFIPVMTGERGTGGSGMFFLVSAAGLMLCRVFNTSFTGKLGRKKVFYLGAVLFCAGFVALAFSYNIWLLAMAAVAYGAGAGFVHPVVNTRAVADCRPRDRGLATGTFMMSQDLGMTAGAVAWGIFSEKTGFGVMYLAVTVISVIMMYVFHKILAGKL